MYFTTNSWSSPSELRNCVKVEVAVLGFPSQWALRFLWTMLIGIGHSLSLIIMSTGIRGHEALHHHYHYRLTWRLWRFVSGLCWPSFGLSSFLQSVAMDVRICKHKSMPWPNGMGHMRWPTGPDVSFSRFGILCRQEMNKSDNSSCEEPIVTGVWVAYSPRRPWWLTAP